MSDESARSLPLIPNARLSTDLPLTLGTSALGSSQLTGCQGDFCDYDMSFLDKDTGDFVSDPQQDFRKHLMAGDRSYVEGLASDDVSIGNRTGITSKKSNKLSVTLPNRLSTTDANNSNNNNNNQKDMKKIPFRLIIQTRQEMSLVKLLLARRKRGEGGDYVSEESYQDLAVSSQIPSLFYKDVDCCSNCYRVYII